ncbi:DUF4097 family beta strand repeat-containing protein [Ammonicoccus fulvus]|uniref:DUF4097 family beta strand repeat-containing protein n=1 Tax=Ammonicoccus fulvus TaxID=3138240 RepID=A0ABZ3FNY9_9ACTN
METPIRADDVRQLVLTLSGGDVVLSDSGGSHVEGTVDTETEPRVTHHGNLLKIQANRRNAVVRLAVPAGINIRLRSARADVVARVPLGDASVVTNSGDVRLGDVSGSVEVITDSGDIDIAAADGAYAQVRSGSGDVTLGRSRGRTEVRCASGDVTVASNHGQLLVKCGSGDVALGVPEGVRTWLDLKTWSGSVHVGLPEAEAPADGGEHASALLHSASGDIRVTGV